MWLNERRKHASYTSVEHLSPVERCSASPTGRYSSAHGERHRTHPLVMFLACVLPPTQAKAGERSATTPARTR